MKYSNIRRFDTKQPILISNSPLDVFYDIFLKKYSSPENLMTDREVPVLKLRPRELLGLVLMSVVGTYIDPNHIVWTPATDPYGYDGAIVRADEEKHQQNMKSGLVVEQIFIPINDKRILNEAIVDSIRKKSSKGSNYSKNINLVILSGKDEDIDIKSIHQYVQSSVYESCYLFIMSDPKPFNFFGAILKAPADPHQLYRITFDIREHKVTIVPTGEFIPILKK